MVSRTQVLDLQDSRTSGGSRHWRTVDIVVTAVIAVAFGVVFWAWSQLYDAVGSAFNGFPPSGGVMVGMWLVPGVLGGLVVRKPGAAFFCELVASVVEMLLGNQWGLSNVVYGIFEGLAPELVFALLVYRFWRWPAALVAGAAAGLASFCCDWVYSYQAWSAGWLTSLAVVETASGLVIAGLGSWWLLRGLAQTGVLAPFASGRQQAAV
jgi:energy-coupling factor transport system substrate-specific component